MGLRMLRISPLGTVAIGFRIKHAFKDGAKSWRKRI